MLLIDKAELLSETTTVALLRSKVPDTERLPSSIVSALLPVSYVEFATTVKLARVAGPS